MAELGVDALLLSVGPDLPYLTGYEAMPLERLTMFVLPAERRARAPRAPAGGARVVERPDLFVLETWDETDDPVARVAGLVGAARRWPSATRPGPGSCSSSSGPSPAPGSAAAGTVLAPLRVVKDAAEIEALRRAARAVDAIAAEMRTRPFAGRREVDVHRELVERMLEAGHDRANFAIVAAGENAASPHHEPSTA